MRGPQLLLILSLKKMPIKPSDNFLRFIGLSASHHSALLLALDQIKGEGYYFRSGF
jgi:hypothetical protein